MFVGNPVASRQGFFLLLKQKERKKGRSIYPLEKQNLIFIHPPSLTKKTSFFRSLIFFIILFGYIKIKITFAVLEW